MLSTTACSAGLGTPCLNEPAKMYMKTGEQRNVTETYHMFKYTSILEYTKKNVSKSLMP